MDEAREFQKLASDPEMIVSVEVGEGYFEASIGDRRRGYRAWTKLNTFAAAVRWLRMQAKALYPQSESVQRLNRHTASVH